MTTSKKGRSRKPGELPAFVTVTIDILPMVGIGGGFRQEWITAENGVVECGLDSGGRLGNPLLTLWIKRKGKDRQYYTADMRRFLDIAVNKIMESQP